MPLTPKPPVLVQNGATLLYDTGTNVATIFVQNLGPNDITITDQAGTINSIVAAANGGPIVLDRVNGKLYAKCPVAQLAGFETRLLVDTD